MNFFFKSLFVNLTLYLSDFILIFIHDNLFILKVLINIKMGNVCGKKGDV